MYNSLSKRAASDQAYENSLIYQGERKETTTYSKIKNLLFNVGDPSLAFHSRLKDVLLKESSLMVPDLSQSREIYPYGTAKFLMLMCSNFKVNIHRLKHYYGGDTPHWCIPYLQTFLRTTKSQGSVELVTL
ncbi:hypothetical protein Tco_1255026 [Tanacetum coccineum]